MEVPNFSLERLLTRLPANISLLGKRKVGKSVCVSMLVKFFLKHKIFSRIICFVANDFCNPELIKILKLNNTPYVIFYKFNDKIVDKILDQQVNLREAGKNCHALIIMDDIYSGHLYHSQSIQNLFQKGRHYLVSNLTSCVSVKSLATCARRSLDYLILYSSLTSTDNKYITQIFLNPKFINIAQYILRNQNLYEALVIESSPRQLLFRLKFRKKKIKSDCIQKDPKPILDSTKNVKFGNKTLSQELREKNGQTVLNETKIDYV